MIVPSKWHAGHEVKLTHSATGEMIIGTIRRVCLDHRFKSQRVMRSLVVAVPGRGLVRLYPSYERIVCPFMHWPMPDQSQGRAA